MSYVLSIYVAAALVVERIRADMLHDGRHLVFSYVLARAFLRACYWVAKISGVTMPLFVDALLPFGYIV